ncbi:hypothetical protein QFC20_001518 [Naganishia adeliensis]|uniref:Uncharacterized protein n=1 Tax=Naganishia adeliensis TaxID=92952 RepID=A0ACC2WT52_9TREE|nr:hypothetical protein QFC20_001518 [Naganishia adeliensis]
MTFQDEYSLTSTGFSLALSTTNRYGSESSRSTLKVPHKYRRRISLPHVTRRGPPSFSRLLQRLLSTPESSDRDDTSTDEAEYDIFQDDRFKPGLFFPHRAGPIVTFSEKVTIFYCKDEEETDQPGTVAQEVAYVKEEGCLSDFEGRDGRRQELALPYKELYCISPIPSRDEEGEDR